MNQVSAINEIKDLCKAKSELIYAMTTKSVCEAKSRKKAPNKS